MYTIEAMVSTDNIVFFKEKNSRDMQNNRKKYHQGKSLYEIGRASCRERV